jgi:hypothetical protein
MEQPGIINYLRGTIFVIVVRRQLKRYAVKRSIENRHVAHTAFGEKKPLPSPTVSSYEYPAASMYPRDHRVAEWKLLSIPHRYQDQCWLNDLRSSGHAANAGRPETVGREVIAILKSR